MKKKEKIMKIEIGEDSIKKAFIDKVPEGFFLTIEFKDPTVRELFKTKDEAFKEMSKVMNSINVKKTVVEL